MSFLIKVWKDRFGECVCQRAGLCVGKTTLGLCSSTSAYALVHEDTESRFGDNCGATPVSATVLALFESITI